MRLSGKVVLVTGAGSGIGECSAKLFASEGAIVIVNDISQQHGQATVDAIIEHGGQAAYISADVTKAEQVEQMTDEIVRRYGRIDVLFNNAGISGVGELHEVEEELWNRVMNVNVTGVYIVSKYVIPHMIRQQSGSIINMSSCIAEIGLARRAPYAASKGAILALTKSMQVDYAKHNIRVNALLPGTIMTPFVEHYLKSSYSDPEAAIQSLQQRQLSGQMGKPSDVAKAALFLASDESQFMMGSPLYIDGGVVFGKNA